jgi:hypothetical protein
MVTKESNDSRNADRRRLLKGVKISYNAGASQFAAVLKNMSDKGGFVEVSEGVIIPEQFTLINDLDGYRVECQVRRRKSHSAGFEFIGEPENFKPMRSQVISMIDGFPESNSDIEKPEISDSVRRRTQFSKPSFGKLVS